MPTAVADNVAYSIWRDTETNWQAANPVIGEGELCWSRDIRVLKIGDGSTRYASLPVLYDGRLLVSDLTSAVQAALDAAQDAQDAADTAGENVGQASNSAQAAMDSASAAQTQANLARDYAQGPPGTVLPTGGDSCVVSAGKAAGIANETRYIPENATDLTADETFTAGHLHNIRDCTATGLVTLTIPPSIFTSTDRKEAWAVIRQRGVGGSVKVVAAAGGSNLQAPQIKASGVWGYRNPTLPYAGGAIEGTAAIPNITAGTLVVVPCATFNSSSSPGMTLANDGGLTLTVRRAMPATVLTLTPTFPVWTAPLVGFTAANVKLQATPATNFQAFVGFWFVLEGTVADAPVYAVQTTAAAASYHTQTLTALAAQSRVIMLAAQRGGSDVAAYSSVSANLSLISSGNTSGFPDNSIGATNNTKNFAYVRATGVPATTADFTARADFTTANDEVALIVMAWAPKTVVGAGNVVLELEGGRDTLSVQHGEMELKFRPDGKTVHVRTSKP